MTETYRATPDIRFGVSDAPLTSLPTDFRTCIKRSAVGISTPQCDAIVGSLDANRGYCSDAVYSMSSYCACVNAPVPYSECVFAPCTINPYAYKTGPMQKTLKRPDAKCPTTVNCSTLQVMGGPTNVAPGVSYPNNCYTLQYWILKNLTSIVFFLILMAILAVLIGYDYVPRKRQARAESLV